MFDTILEIKLGDEFFGIDSDKANQILRVPPITPIPLSASFLKGVVVLNGKVVSVVDLKEILGIGEVDVTHEKSRLVTITIDNEEVGVLVDEVVEASEFIKENYEENTSEDKVCIGFYKTDDRQENIKILEEKLGYPMIIKPAALGSSIGINISRRSFFPNIKLFRPST